MTGYPGVPTQNTLTAVHVSSSGSETGYFDTSVDILNGIQHNIIWYSERTEPIRMWYLLTVLRGQRSNLMSVPTDCDQRDERLGWMADAHLSAHECLHNFFPAAYEEKKKERSQLVKRLTTL